MYPNSPLLLLHNNCVYRLIHSSNTVCSIPPSPIVTVSEVIGLSNSGDRWQENTNKVGSLKQRELQSMLPLCKLKLTCGLFNSSCGVYRVYWEIKCSVGNWANPS